MLKLKTSITIFLNSFEISFFTIKYKKYISIANVHGIIYFFIPDFVSFSIKNHILIFEKNKKFVFNPILFNQYTKQISAYIFHLKQPIKQKLIFKGLGFRLNISEDYKYLIFKLGYSHLITLQIPSIVSSVKIKKKFFYIESFSKSELGNLIYRIKQFRLPDSYKGKGIWLKNEKKKLKQVKKK